MNDIARTPARTTALSEAAIARDDFLAMRAANLGRWPTGAAVDFDEAVAFHHAQPPHKQLAAAMRRAHAERRCLTQPRGGFGTLAMQKALMIALDRDGLADIVPTTTDSYTRNEQFAAAQKGIDESERLGRSLLNGFPIVDANLDDVKDPHTLAKHPGLQNKTGHIGFLGHGAQVEFRNLRIKELP